MIIEVHIGGIHSRFVRSIYAAGLIGVPTPPNIYLKSLDYAINGFDCVLDQQLAPNAAIYSSEHCGMCDPSNMIDNPNLDKIRDAASKLQFKKELLSQVEYYANLFQLSGESLGIHTRFTDMELYHSKHYTSLQIDDYINKTKDVLNTHNIKNIFVSSDNEESLEKLSKIFKINFVPNLLRAKHQEDVEFYNMQISNFNNCQLWIESFLEAFLLSKCGIIISRISNLPNTAIILSKTIKKDYRLNVKC